MRGRDWVRATASVARCVHRIDHVEARHHRAQVVLGGEGVVVVEEACMATAQVGVRVRAA